MEFEMNSDGSIKVVGDTKDIKQLDKNSISSLQELAEKYYDTTRAKADESFKKNMESSITMINNLSDAKVRMIEAEGEAIRNRRKKSFKQLLEFGAVLGGIYGGVKIALAIKSHFKKDDLSFDLGVDSEESPITKPKDTPKTVLKLVDTSKKSKK